jgi:hypothetical protein
MVIVGEIRLEKGLFQEILGTASFWLVLKNWARLVFGLFRARLEKGFFYTISSHHLIITLPLYAHTDMNSTSVL